MFALKALASKGVNVIMVLHQPSYPLYQMFTNALLLGKGGRTVFLGKSGDALAYFTHIGFTMPPFLNPADFFMVRPKFWHGLALHPATKSIKTYILLFGRT